MATTVKKWPLYGALISTFRCQPNRETTSTQGTSNGGRQIDSKIVLNKKGIPVSTAKTWENAELWIFVLAHVVINGTLSALMVTNSSFLTLAWEVVGLFAFVIPTASTFAILILKENGRGDYSWRAAVAAICTIVSMASLVVVSVGFAIVRWS